MNIKKIIKKMVECKPNETIRDAFYRHNIDLQKKFYKKKYSISDLRKELNHLGIQSGNNIMLHSGYKAFFNFEGTPNDLINMFIDIIGEDGTLVMPCYGKDKYNFDVDNDISSAGVISECFRKHDGVIRSRGSHFSCAAYGKHRIDIVNDHELSTYGFDKHSPYYKFVSLDNPKIVMIGLGRKSVKLSLYHLPELMLINEDKFYKSLFNKKYTSYVSYMENGEKKVVKHDDMCLRDDTIPNVRQIRKLYKQDFVTYGKISNLDIVVIDAKRALDYILNEAYKGNYMIKRKNKF